jgi:hypothetical protein
MIIESIHKALDGQSVNGFYPCDLQDLIQDIGDNDDVIDYEEMVFYGNGHNPTHVKITLDNVRRGIVLLGEHNGTPLNDKDSSWFISRDEIEKIKNDSLDAQFNAFRALVLDKVERGIVEAILDGNMTEESFHAPAPVYNLMANVPLTAELLKKLYSSVGSAMADYVDFPNDLDDSTANDIYDIFCLVNELKKILVKE